MRKFCDEFLDILCGSEDSELESGYFHKLRAYLDNTAPFPEEELEQAMKLANELDAYLEEKRPILDEDLFGAKYYKEIFLVETAYALGSQEDEEIYDRFYSEMIHS